MSEVLIIPLDEATASFLHKLSYHLEGIMQSEGRGPEPSLSHRLDNVTFAGTEVEEQSKMQCYNLSNTMEAATWPLLSRCPCLSLIN
jgi:hypothetical protein